MKSNSKRVIVMKIIPSFVHKKSNNFYFLYYKRIRIPNYLCPLLQNKNCLTF